MNRLLDRLAQVPMLGLSFLVMALAGVALRTLTQDVGGALLDFQLTGSAAREVLSAMSTGQREVHAWATLLGDTAYPAAYGAFFGGLIARFGGAWRVWLAAPLLAGVGLDFVENAVQALALIGAVDLLDIKTLVTPAKFALVIAGIAAALIASLIAAIRALVASKEPA